MFLLNFILLNRTDGEKTGKEFLICGNIFHRLESGVQGIVAAGFVRGRSLLSSLVSRPLTMRGNIQIFKRKRPINLLTCFPRYILPNARSATPRNGMTHNSKSPRGEV
jgi:hypothetical protein